LNRRSGIDNEHEDGRWARCASRTGEEKERPGRLVTVDEIVMDTGIAVGFIRADVEGSGLAVATGPIEAPKRGRPGFAFACYDSFEDISRVSKFLSEQFTNYLFEGHIENGMDFALSSSVGL
jgi:hypothetical protein